MIEILKQYKYVSFDAFDTLIFRTFLKPYDQLGMVPIIYEQETGEKLDEFVSLRKNAEQKARCKRPGCEVTLDLIYENLPYEKELKDRLKRIECNVEIDNCIANLSMVGLLNKCRDLGKIIVITTDMYLPRWVFEKIFEKIHVKFDFLFISCEEEKTKYTGELYPIDLKKLGIDAHNLIHVGDNLISDIEQAQRNGIKAIERIQNPICDIYTSVKDKCSILENHFLSLLQRGLQQKKFSSERRIGYSVLGPLLFDFCKWLNQVKENRKLDVLIFVAREGFLIKNVYDLMYPDDRTAYACMNKNMLRLPLLKGKDKKSNFLRSIPGRDFYTWEDILRYLGIRDIEEKITLLGNRFPTYDFKTKISRIVIESDACNSVFDFLFALQSDEIQKQNDLLLNYVESLGLLNEKCGLVNNSMNGSGQSLLEDFLHEHNIDNDILGLHFTKTEKCEKLLGSHCEAWLKNSNISHYEEFRFRSLSVIFEHLCFEPKGTSLYLYENEKSDACVFCEKPRREIENFKIVAEIQEAALDFIRDLSKYISIIHSYSGLNQFLSFLQKPFDSDARLICNLWDDDIEGDRLITDLSIPFERKNLKYNS